MKILFLSPWFPYPLSQGSKIRAYYLIKALARHHEVALVSFADTKIEPSWVAHMQEICKNVEVISHNPFVSDRIKAWMGWLSTKPSTVVASYSPAMTDKVCEVMSSWQPDIVFAFTFVTAPYAIQVKDAIKVIDVDNLMERMLYEGYLFVATFSKRARKWLAWIKFRKYEKMLYSKFDLCMMLTERDRDAVLDFIPIQTKRVGVLPNGVDIQFNSPNLVKPVPNQLVYNGALTYHPNFDAMDFFLRDIFPLITEKIPETQISITGGTYGVPISMLPLKQQVNLTGYLDDIRPVVAGSWACVVPLRLGGGTRIKILEAMALGTPVISTSKGAEGLEIEPEKHLLIGDTPQEFAAQTVRLLQSPGLRESLVTNALQLVREKYDWNNIGERFNQYLSSAAMK